MKLNPRKICQMSSDDLQHLRLSETQHQLVQIQMVTGNDIYEKGGHVYILLESEPLTNDLGLTYAPTLFVPVRASLLGQLFVCLSDTYKRIDKERLLSEFSVVF